MFEEQRLTWNAVGAASTGVERRWTTQDLSGPWTKDEFNDRYVGLAEWELAAPDEGGFLERRGFDAFSGNDAYKMLGTDLAACRRVCVDRGFGAFAIWRGYAYFRRESAVNCCRHLREVGAATLYINLHGEVKRSQADLQIESLPIGTKRIWLLADGQPIWDTQPEAKVDAVELRWDPLDLSGPWSKAEFEKKNVSPDEWKLAEPDSGGFLVRRGFDAFPGLDAHKMDASNLTACRRVCIGSKFGAFAVWEGQAYFRKEDPRLCCQNLSRNGDATLYINVHEEASRRQAQSQSEAPPRVDAVTKGRWVLEEEGKAAWETETTTTSNNVERRWDPVDLSGPWTKSTFKKKYGGLDEWATAAPDEGGFLRMHGRDAFPGKDADEMPAADLAACRRLCIERGYGAFTVWGGTAYFRKQAPKECCKKLCDVNHASIFINVHVEAEQRRAQAWAERMRELIGMEWQEEERQMRQRLEEWPLSRLVKQGVAIFGLKAQRAGFFFGEPSIKFSVPGSDLPQHDFQRGDEVIVSDGSPLGPSAMRAQVALVTPQAISCVMQDVPRPYADWRLDKGSNRTIYDRTVKAVSFFGSDRFQARAVQRVLLGIGNVADHNEAPIALDLDASTCMLNDSQTEALYSVEHKRVGLIQGPPGCGKTHTSCALLRAACKESKTALAVADSHVAVDQLLGGLLALGVKAVRLGTAASVTDDSLRKVSMQLLFEEHSRHEEWQGLREALFEGMRKVDDLQRSASRGFARGPARGSSMEKEVDEVKASASKEGEEDVSSAESLAEAKEFVLQQRRKVRSVESAIAAEIVCNADVVCSTLGGCGADVLADVQFDLVLVDEATQATEPRALIAINKLKPDGRLVLVGDQKQLPPVCVCQQAQELGLGISLFDRLLGKAGMKETMLTVQFRMHPLISAWPSQMFYEGRLVDGVTAADREPVSGFGWPAAGGVAFLPTNDPEESTPDGSSKLNHGEAALMVRIVDQLLLSVPPSDIGVISPYRGQVGLLKRLVGKKVEVRTVDGYQGREKAVILMSCVRSNRRGNVGFLADCRRLNVALTRAQRGLIVVGNPETLSCDPSWRSWLDFVDTHGLRLDPDVAVSRDAATLAPVSSPMRTERAKSGPHVAREVGCASKGGGRHCSRQLFHASTQRCTSRASRRSLLVGFDICSMLILLTIPLGPSAPRSRLHGDGRPRPSSRR